MRGLFRENTITLTDQVHDKLLSNDEIMSPAFKEHKKEKSTPRAVPQKEGVPHQFSSGL